jgi:hypothetical protein
VPNNHSKEILKDRHLHAKSVAPRQNVLTVAVAEADKNSWFVG